GPPGPVGAGSAVDSELREGFVQRHLSHHKGAPSADSIGADGARGTGLRAAWPEVDLRLDEDRPLGPPRADRPLPWHDRLLDDHGADRLDRPSLRRPPRE